MQREVELFYPWESVEAQYYENTVFQNVHSINRNLAQDEKIKVVGLGRRQNFTIGDDEIKIYNYRDEYMFNVAKEYIDGAEEDEKILILCGSAHGYIDVVKRFNPHSNSKYDWVTLGSRLRMEYGDAFLSLSYIAVDSATRDSVFYRQLKKSDSWQATNITGKFVTLQDAEEINGAIPIFFDGNYLLYDGFIMDKHAKYGVKYCYKLDDPAVLESVIAQTEKLYQSLQEDISFYYKHGTDALELACSLIPHEIWPLYWNVVMNFRLKNFGEALRYTDLFLGEELSRSTFCLPDVLEIAIESCTETGRDSSEYAKMLEGLSNELGIAVDKMHLFCRLDKEP